MTQNITYKVLKSFLSPFSLWFVKEIRGLNRIPKEGPFVIVANHTSYIDPVIIKAFFDKYFNKIVFYLAKKEAYNNFFKRKFFEASGTIPVDRQKKGREAFNSALAKLKDGQIIGLFPESTRSADGRLHTGKTGAARLAIYAKCPMLPIGIKNTFEIWPKHKKLPKFKKVVILNIGKHFTLDEYYNKRLTKKLLMSITKDIMIKISKLSGQEYSND